jgi:hypothetical protein
VSVSDCAERFYAKEKSAEKIARHRIHSAESWTYEAVVTARKISQGEQSVDGGIEEQDEGKKSSPTYRQ